MELRRKSIYGIYQKINLIFSEHLPGLFSFKIFLDHYEVKRRIYILEALCQHIALRLSDCRVQRQKLSVLVCHGHIVTVEDDKMTDAGTHDHLRSVTSYAADSYDCNGRVAEMLKHLLPHQHSCPFLPIVHATIL